LSMIAQSTIGWVLILAGQTDRAIHQLQSVLQLNPDFMLAHYWMALALELKGRPVEAMPFLHRVLELSRGCTHKCSLTLAALARVNAAAGNTDAAHQILSDLLERESSGVYVSSYEIGKIYQSLGDVPAALARLERAYTDRAHSMAFLNVDPQLLPLAENLRFQRLVERVEKSLDGEPPRFAMAG